MNLIYTQFKLLYSNISSNIAYYPSLITAAGLVFAFIMLYLEQLGASTILIEELPHLVIKDAGTARTLISTFIGGIISIMVFSFSMVMLLLNQASNSYSPRILPELISNKRNQFILGFYIAVIIYNVLILIGIEPTSDKGQLPGLSILVGIVLSVHVLPAFIYFINSISQSIQINNIIYNIHNTASLRLKTLIENEKNVKGKEVFEDTSDWKVYTTESDGYVSNIAYESMVNLGKEVDAFFELQVPKGSFILKRTPLVSCSKELSEDQLVKLHSCFGYERIEVVRNNYLLGFKQLTEIALKAMSPGINDPGTAITCIDYMTRLFVQRMCKKEDSYIINKESTAIIKVKVIPFAESLYYIYASLRQYCKQDIIMMSKLLSSLISLSIASSENKEYDTAIAEQVKLIMQDAKENIENAFDYKKLEYLAETIKIKS